MYWLNEINLTHINEVGGKNASLGEMIQAFVKNNIAVPDGFVVPVSNYFEFIEHNKLKQKIHDLLYVCDINDVECLSRVGLKIRMEIKNANIPQHLSERIIRYYHLLSKKYNQDITDVAVRSSATAEDLPNASFAGQQETYLNVRGEQSLLDSVRNCFASLFTDRAISYRAHFGFDAFSIGLSVGVQKMVRSDLGASGVAFSLDTESGFKDVVLISGSYGLGELIVQGSVNPDEYLVFKPTLSTHSSIIEKKLGTKKIKMSYATDPDERTKTISVPLEKQRLFCLNDEQILTIARWVHEIEKHYTQLHGRWSPMDVEWALDGLSNQLYIVQARPETVHSQKDHVTFLSYEIESTAKPKVLLEGISVGDRIGNGEVRVLYNLDGRDGSMDGKSFKDGEVLVTDMTDPDWEPLMKKASAIVTNQGGRTCHAAIVARELGIPAIVGSLHATDVLKNGQHVTVSCASGAKGFVYEGHVPYVKKEISLRSFPKTKTPLMLNIGNPDHAFAFANYPHQGVGLAREEFIINQYIQVHPMALLMHEKLNDESLTKKIKELIHGFENEEHYFIEKLSFGIAKIAAAFYPKPVIVRFSDFKSNEYANLLGGQHFEPKEENPMIGFRGASRYYSPAFIDAFLMECRAIHKVRQILGLKNVIVMIPFCRTVDELLKVLSTMELGGLKRGENDLKVYLMAEIPSNIILAKEFAKHIDGFSIGSNDLTQLVLGLDRDSSIVSSLYDERNPAVLNMIEKLIQEAKACGVKVGICGQGPSDYPDFAKFLVEKGIDSISVTPDSLLKTSQAIFEAENS